jgi:seryl-tRNA synthetase
MIDKKTSKRLKQIDKERSKLKKQIKKLEFRPCHSDFDLRQKDEEIKGLREKDHELEKEHDSYILKTGNMEHSP